MDADPIKPMAEAMAKAAKEEGVDLPVEFCALLAIVGLQALKPNQLMLLAGTNSLDDEEEPGDQELLQALAGDCFNDMILAALQDEIEPTHEGTDTEN